MDSITDTKHLEYLWNGELKQYQKFIFLGNNSRQRPLFGEGIYFLWNRDGLQYVGQSNFIWQRLEKHHVIGKSKSGREGWIIGIIPVKDSRERLHLEAYCIDVFRPAKNGTNPSAAGRYYEIKRLRFEGKTLQAIGNIFGVSRERIRQILNSD